MIRFLDAADWLVFIVGLPIGLILASLAGRLVQRYLMWEFHIPYDERVRRMNKRARA